MGKLRVTAVVEYEINPEDYGVETMEQAAGEERVALKADAIGTLSWLLDDSAKFTVEVVE